MKALLEFHILQNFAPSNLNRDDTGSPKDAFFGGFRRARISSQSIKRAMREYVASNELVMREAQGVRTKRIVKELQDQLLAMGHPAEESKAKAVLALGSVGLKIVDEDKSQYLLFLGNSEISGIAQVIHQHWDDLTVASTPTAALEEGKKKEKTDKKAEKAAAKAAVGTDIQKALGQVLDGGRAVDVSLFGRMVADAPKLNQDAACQVAHPISVNKFEREFDFYTAVDDLKPDDTAGADMLGTIEFGSSCFYRYAALDLLQLRSNLQDDLELLYTGIEAFLRASVKAKPSGKQNSFAAHNDPEYVVFTVRQNADPRNLANAFERPVYPNNSQSLTNMAAETFEIKWKKLETAYGQAGPTFTLNLSDYRSTLGTAVTNLDQLIAETLKAVKATLGA
jgi:CRISPR system Cascade subunit CasC